MLCVDLMPRALNVLMLRTQILLTLAGQDRTGRHVLILTSWLSSPLSQTTSQGSRRRFSA